ncbi:MAG: nicotinate-nucleotide diphosphorylase [Thermoguttaceae bacterium]
MDRDFNQNVWDETVEHDLAMLLKIAVWEDLGVAGDLTSQALIPLGMQGRAALFVRSAGVIAGIAAIPKCLGAVDSSLKWFANCKDGQFVEKGAKLGEIVGPVLSMLTVERLLLNLLGHLCGVATMTRQFVEAVEGTGARIYDTRKTTLGWRRLDKYAVRCGGGYNHRTGLFDAILIKDNHLAFGNLPGYVLDSNHTVDDSLKNDQSEWMEHRSGAFSSAESINRARSFLTKLIEEQKKNGKTEPLPVDRLPIIEIEVESIENFDEVLAAKPDIVLLDNMTTDMLREAVAIRNKFAPDVELEASGGVTLQTVRAVAETGVERISSGSLTHSNFSLDIGLDWEG